MTGYPVTARVLLAEMLATVLHEGQVRKDDSPMIHHCLRVAASLIDRGEDAMIVGWLHDVLEDTGVGFTALNAIFGLRVAIDVASVTRRIAEPYETYINRLCESGTLTALYVKDADLTHNLEEPIESLMPRYVWAQEKVRAAIAVREGAYL